jgi:hypothetical protein
VVAAVAYSVMLACALLASYMPGKQSSKQSEQEQARRIETCEIWKLATRWQPTTRQRQHDETQPEGTHMGSGGRRQERSTVSTASLAARDGRCEVPIEGLRDAYGGRGFCSSPPSSVQLGLPSPGMAPVSDRPSAAQ